MKWIGQHIVDLIARFRGDVYLEDVSSGTIASGGNLGLDSNNKIVKATEASGGISFDGSTANGVLTYKDSDEASVESTLTYDTNSLIIGTNDDQEAAIKRLVHSDDAGGNLNIYAGGGTGTDKAGGNLNLYGGGSTGAAVGGEVNIYGSFRQGSSNANVNVQTLLWGTQINQNIIQHHLKNLQGPTDDDFGFISDGSMDFTIDKDNDETNQLFSFYDYTTLQASISDAGYFYIRTGINLGDADTTLTRASAGDVNIEGNLIYRAGGTDVPVADGGTGASTFTTNAILTGNGTSAIQAESTLTYDSETLTIGADDDGQATIKRMTHSDDAGGDLYLRGGDSTGTNKAGGVLRLYGGRSTGNESGGNIGIYSAPAGSSGSSVNNIYTTQAIALFKPDMSTTLGGNLIFEGATPDAHETILAPADPTSDATITIPNQTGTLLTSGDNTVDTVTFISANADDPTVTIKNTTNDNQGARLQFRKNRTDTSVDNDRVGEIDFIGENASGDSQQYGKIMSQALEVDAGNEAGRLSFLVAQYDGGIGTSGLDIEGSKTADSTINVNIAAGTDSTTTVAGDLTVAGASAKFTNNTIQKPVVEIKNTGNNASGGMLKFTLDKGAVGADNDVPGGIQWVGDNDAQEQTTFGQLYTQVSDATDGQEAGTMFLQVAEYDGALTTGLKIDGNTDANGEIDVTIGAGAASATTITGDLTVSGGDITLSGTGRIQGVDTVTSSTDAANKSYVDGKYSYQYIHFVGNSTVRSNGSWEIPSPNGVSNHTWTQPALAPTGTGDVATTTVGEHIGVDRLNQAGGIRMPYAGTVVGFTGMGRNSNADRVFYAGLFVGTPDWGTTNAIDAELIAVATADHSPGAAHTARPSKLDDMSRSYSIAAGDVIYPAIRGDGSNADTCIVSFTVVIKIPIV